ncbi:MAG: copper transport protein [Gaiellaceae bacterium]|nr:copper transport protein [Gaiellaceae bacterium]
MRRALVPLVVVAAALVLPAAAWSHAALLRTIPAASGVLSAPPKQVSLIYSEAVEPRFAVVSVTDAQATQLAAGPAHRSASNVDELDVPLKQLREGWYLVVWRVISVDGHPVRGAFTFAVGPNPGPAPQFAIPTLSETAATPSLVAARWVTFLSMLAAIGLFVLRIAIARPMISRVAGTRLREVSIAFWVSLGIALVATPVYVLMATAQFALRSFWSFGALVPLLRVSAFGRGYLDLELVLALFGVAAGVAIWLDRPDRAQRSIAALLALGGAALAAGAALLVPGVAGHADQTSPRALALFLDWLHLGSAALWVGGLIGLLVLWRSLPVAQRVAGLVVSVPRFSNVAFGSVLALLASGIWASVLHLPTLGSLWQTSYGQTILVKAALLLCAMLVAAVNLLRTKPRLASAVANPSIGPAAAALLRRLVATEVVLVSGAVLAAAVLSSLAPPPKALAGIGNASAHTGPGPVTEVVDRNGYRVKIQVTPNRAAVPNEFAVDVTRAGAPVRGADVVATFTMLDMEMPSQSYQLSESKPGLYERASPSLVMVGHWGLAFTITPRGAQPFTVLLVDRANG